MYTKALPPHFKKGKEMESFLTYDEAKEKYNRLPQDHKDRIEKEFGIGGTALWIYFATICPLTKEGEKL